MKTKIKNIKDLIAKYRKQWDKDGMDSVISYSQVVSELEALDLELKKKPTKSNSHDIKTLALIKAKEAEIEGMKIDNTIREIRGESPAWSCDDFFAISEDLNKIAMTNNGLKIYKELFMTFELYLHEEYGEKIVSGAIDEFMKHITKK